MLLRTVRLQNFRAVKSAKISFDRATVLIGENDCGRSSVMEAIALALGWNAPDGEFCFQPFHLHRDPCQPDTAAPTISIVLEFTESSPAEWDGDAFAVLRAALPQVLSPPRTFSLQVEHNGNATHWSFRSAAGDVLGDDRALLTWLRRRMPVFWLSEGMAYARAAGTSSPDHPPNSSTTLADQVSSNYRDLLQGTALDVGASIERGAEAARELFLARTDPHAGEISLGQVIEEITGKSSATHSAQRNAPVGGFGTAAQKIGLLLLAGSLLRSGAGRLEHGGDPLTLIENPEAHLHPMTLASIWGVIERVEGQKIVGTHSGTLLASARLASIRRLTRHDGLVTEWRVPEGSLTPDELRRYSYHLRSRRAAASFARCWLLVEGETEYWLMGELARLCGYDFSSEGVVCVEFAQCGLGCLVKVARRLGIEWHLLADGDHAGQNYARSARQYASPAEMRDRITVLQDPDVEHCFWKHGFADVFRDAAYPRHIVPAQRKTSPKAVIAKAIDRHSKPFLAVLLLDALTDGGSRAVPPPLRSAIEICIRLARAGGRTSAG